jgi:hypothetical protein
MRNIRPSRNLGDSKANDTQRIIDEKPSTVTIYRQSGNSRTDGTYTLTATFQARIDDWRNTQRDWRTNLATKETDNIFLMTARHSTDKNGATVDFEFGDEVRVGTTTYIVISKVEETYKCEGILILRTP